MPANCLQVSEAAADLFVKSAALMRFSQCSTKKCDSCIHRRSCREIFLTISAYEAMQLPDQVELLKRVMQNAYELINTIQRDGTNQYIPVQERKT